MDAVIYTKLILILLSSNFLDFNHATLSSIQLAFPCAKSYQKGELNVDCSYKRLRYIPDLPPNTVHLNLRHNIIKQVFNNTFKHMTNLKVLDLSFNWLKSMDNQTFNGLGNLKHLKLNNNMLTGEMPNKCFQYMNCLTDLDLSFNSWKRINLQTFVGLQNLQSLQLNDNKLDYSILKFPPGCFKPLESLTRLSIHNNNVLAHILNDNSVVFPDKTISDLKMLEILELDIHSGSSDENNLFGKGFSFLTKAILAQCY
ncbi:unnamed protein product [Mytilus edulis]|uniref:Uncharacterized protein n=1 Tax=Mytilus edulis TaxID=6550 RepID=A0A8S3RAV3_MYTED|nr:unnamed protein product [Mytilus edulis]